MEDCQQQLEEESAPLLTCTEREGGEGEEKEDEKGEGEEGAEGENKEEPEEELSAGAKVGNMPAGDYTIHILVQNARQLIADGDDTCDPSIQFEINDVTGKTTKK